jgi:hypothetical protein
MITDQEIASHLIDNCSRRMSGKEMALCHYVNQEGTLLDGDRPMFASLKTQFATELCNVATLPATRETTDVEGGSLL